MTDRSPKVTTKSDRPCRSSPFRYIYKAHNLNFVLGSNPNEHRMEIEKGIVGLYLSQIRKLEKCKYECKTLSSLKHCVRSQITRLKLQKSFCDLEHGVSL